MPPMPAKRETNLSGGRWLWHADLRVGCDPVIPCVQVPGRRRYDLRQPVAPYTGGRLGAGGSFCLPSRPAGVLLDPMLHARLRPPLSRREILLTRAAATLARRRP